MGVILFLALIVGDANTELHQAQKLFFQGRYQRVLSLLENVLLTDLSDSERLTALEFEAFSYYLLDRPAEAARSWQEILALDPAHEPDPVYVPPTLLAFFRELPRPGPSPPVPPAPAEALSAERGCGNWLCLVPLGGGQFANGKIVKGIAFAATEVLLLSLNVGLYWINQREWEEYGRFPDRDLAERRNVLQNTFFGLLATTLIYGIVDAYLFP